MPVYRIVNCYTCSATHEVEADSEEEAFNKGRSIDDSLEDRVDSMEYIETVSLGKIKD